MNTDETDRRHESDIRVMIDAIKTFGRGTQLVVAVEELSELQKELCKALRGEKSIDHIAEEVADVDIILSEVVLLFDCAPDVLKWRNEKMLRLRERIDEARAKRAEREAKKHD